MCFKTGEVYAKSGCSADQAGATNMHFGDRTDDIIDRTESFNDESMR